MGKTTVWDVYLKTQEMRSAAIRESVRVPITSIAKELSIEADVAEECAIVLDQLNLVQFDVDSKEITLPN